MLALHWVARVRRSRALSVTRAGEVGLSERFKLPSDWRLPAPAATL
jgi:hypothetical protein